MSLYNIITVFSVQMIPGMIKLTHLRVGLLVMLSPPLLRTEELDSRESELQLTDIPSCCSPSEKSPVKKIGIKKIILKHEFRRASFEALLLLTQR